MAHAPSKGSAGIMLAHHRDLKGACRDGIEVSDDRADEILASTQGWAHPVRSLSALLHSSGRATRSLLCPGAAAEPNCPDHLWTIERVLCGSDRKETAESFSSRHLRAVVRHGGMQSLVQVLSELGHEQVT